MELSCPYCGAEALLESSLLVYKKDYGSVYVCSNYPGCDAYVGCHPGTNIPLGRLADKELRFWKQRAHEYLDVLWKAKVIMIRKRYKKEGKKYFYKRGEARTQAYKWLSVQLGIDLKDCHIGLFDVQTCQQVAQICYPYAKKYLHLKNAKVD
jgi:ssDNA-binding Zn-finger/Zn-ribbon topoisomerase 1